MVETKCSSEEKERGKKPLVNTLTIEYWKWSSNVKWYTKKKKKQLNSEWRVLYFSHSHLREWEKEKRKPFNSFVLKSHCNDVYNFILTTVTNESVLGYLIDRKSSSAVSMTDILTQLTGQVDRRWKWNLSQACTMASPADWGQSEGSLRQPVTHLLLEVHFHQLTGRSIDPSINRLVYARST